MGGGLIELSVAALLFVGSHFLLSSIPVRGRVAGAPGGRGFLGLYSVLALVLFAWLAWSYGRAPVVPLWSPPEGAAWLALLAMPLALLLLVGGYSQPNPTAVMQEKATGDRPAPGILAITRHPVMWAISLW